ncbi:MAG: 30S ribosomal protein S16 [Candidatus Komeilibacteria bacterium CG10_big_fil_rev_8_21_14_0_10_41_13]|uniref:Small ribosomal subunit protein bS16 n=1 Tax=Candidatus Komeilibacteria bacterium CG10_big_fil_rev_8_21_14_0_10_41_13 TaxID=1974476 RepID=A0A2M6WC68_9BACT|nr:MAG: 30S ribosomal protein S16 [Candidatus Komeilibacteria bacterium CG10_big_fil_rev_8_21_14_0_10_41_13]
MLSIRFTRVGKKKQPHYRIIVLEKHKDPWGKYLELLGNYNPKTKEAILKVDRIKHWLSVGAQASETVHNLLIKEGVVEGKKKRALKISKKRRTKLDAKKKAAEEKAQAKTAKAEEAKVELASSATPQEEAKSEAPEAMEEPKQEEVKAEAPEVEKTEEAEVDKKE